MVKHGTRTPLYIMVLAEVARDLAKRPRERRFVTRESSPGIHTQNTYPSYIDHSAQFSRVVILILQCLGELILLTKDGTNVVRTVAASQYLWQNGIFHDGGTTSWPGKCYYDESAGGGVNGGSAIFKLIQPGGVAEGGRIQLPVGRAWRVTDAQRCVARVTVKGQRRG